MVDMGIPAQMGYDRAIVVFSPEGRIYQVEYAAQAVKLGKTSVGVVFKDGVVLAAYSPIENLQISSKSSKVSKIDEHMAAVDCGLTADARVLKDFLRVQAQIHRLTYGRPIEVFLLAKKLADRMQIYTQYGGTRPFGVSILLGGVNNDPVLYVVNPSGTLDRWKAKALGRGEKEATNYLEKNYKENMTEEEAKKLAVAAIETGEKKQGKFDKKAIELSIVKK
jgi:proteasome alpha subunit